MKAKRYEVVVKRVTVEYCAIEVEVDSKYDIDDLVADMPSTNFDFDITSEELEVDNCRDITQGYY